MINVTSIKNSAPFADVENNDSQIVQFLHKL
jgi:hypothetical protein